MSEPFLRHRLYRNPAKGKVFGVCAGIADAFDWDAWAVRAGLLIVGFFTAFGPVIIAYLIAFFILDPHPGNKPEVSGTSSRFNERVQEAKQSFKKDAFKSTHLTAKEIEEKFLAIKTRVESLEAHVTSEKFLLEKEFRKMREAGQ